jgi:sugar-specific transcriptional regulator TrmB
VKIAQVKISSGSTVITEQHLCETMEGHGWVRLTEYTEVEFVPLPPAEVVDKQLKQLDDAEQKLRENFQQKLNELAEERGKLRALTNESAS